MIQLDYRDARPLYEQIRDSFRELILSGALKKGDQLPSVRSLASSLAINPNTIKRAYDALEQDGYICSVPGKGCFAAPVLSARETRKQELLAEFDKACGELKMLGATAEELRERIEHAEVAADD